MNSLSASALKENVCKLDSALQRLLGFAPAIIRPPYGECNQTPLNLLAGWGFSVVNWNIDSLDWSNHNAATSTNYYKTAMGSADPTKTSFIGLNHEAEPSTTIGVNGGTPSTALIIDYGMTTL